MTWGTSIKSECTYKGNPYFYLRYPMPSRGSPNLLAQLSVPFPQPSGLSNQFLAILEKAFVSLEWNFFFFYLAKTFLFIQTHQLWHLLQQPTFQLYLAPQGCLLSHYVNPYSATPAPQQAGPSSLSLRVLLVTAGLLFLGTQTTALHLFSDRNVMGGAMAPLPYKRCTFGLGIPFQGMHRPLKWWTTTLG